MTIGQPWNCRSPTQVCGIYSTKCLSEKPCCYGYNQTYRDEVLLQFFASRLMPSGPSVFTTMLASIRTGESSSCPVQTSISCP